MASDNFPHDAAYKTFFSNPDMVKSLLQDFVPEDFIRDFDFDTLEKCSGSYTTVDLQQRHDDIVWRLVGQSSVDEPEEDNVMLEQKFRQWEQEFIQKGMLAGEEKGRAEGLAEGLHTQKTTLLEMLSDRFGKIPAGWRETVNSLTDPDIVSRLTRAILYINYILKVKSADEYASLLTQEVNPQ